MVWPPPKVLRSPEGEVTVPATGSSSPEVSGVITGLPPDEGGSPPPSEPSPAMLPGVTVSVMAATSVPRDWLERPEGLFGAVLGSRYRITSLIGRGPMGIACEGESSRGRQVTLKLLPRAPELPVEHFAWQVRQALALAHFDHPNVTPINDFGALEDGSAFVSRARVPGVTLRTVLRQGGLPLQRSLDIARQIAAALATAHVQDIAHGRLKPENVILQGGTRPGDLVKVVDFGMAGLPVNLRAVAPNETEARRLALRTRLYLPADVTGASPSVDIYSLGVLLFEMIAGQPPFVFESLPPSGPQQAPLSFAQCSPTLVVPGSVNELVFALLHPQAAEHGLDAERVGQMLDALLGRPSATRAAEPVTGQRPSAHPPAQGLDAASLVSGAPTPEAQVFAPPNAASPDAEGGPNADAPFWPGSRPPSPAQRGQGEPSTDLRHEVVVWPSSPAPAPDRSHSFPPLPGGFSGSSFPPPRERPPPRRSQASAAREPTTPASALPASLPPPANLAGGSRPPPIPARRPASLMDEPFATHSFPPPSITVPLAPNVPNIAVTPSSAPGVDDAEPELRPSFVGRLKRLFGKKPPGEF
jgi:eukaryotic-like serine/threonine-protein kinase